jgi:hypothetical protein
VKVVSNIAVLIPLVFQRYAFNSPNQIKLVLMGNRYLSYIFIFWFPRNHCAFQLFTSQFFSLSRVDVELCNQCVDCDKGEQSLPSKLLNLALSVWCQDHWLSNEYILNFLSANNYISLCLSSPICMVKIKIFDVFDLDVL